MYLSTTNQKEEEDQKTINSSSLLHQQPFSTLTLERLDGEDWPSSNAKPAGRWPRVDLRRQAAAFSEWTELLHFITYCLLSQLHSAYFLASRSKASYYMIIYVHELFGTRTRNGIVDDPPSLRVLRYWKTDIQIYIPDLIQINSGATLSWPPHNQCTTYWWKKGLFKHFENIS